MSCCTVFPFVRVDKRWKYNPAVKYAMLWYSSFLSLGWRAVAIMFYKLLIEEAVLNSRLQHLVFSFLLYRLGHILAGPGIIPVTAALLISL